MPCTGVPPPPICFTAPCPLHLATSAACAYRRGPSSPKPRVRSDGRIPAKSFHSPVFLTPAGTGSRVVGGGAPRPVCPLLVALQHQPFFPRSMAMAPKVVAFDVSPVVPPQRRPALTRVGSGVRRALVPLWWDYCRCGSRPDDLGPAFSGSMVVGVSSGAPGLGTGGPELRPIQLLPCQRRRSPSRPLHRPPSPPKPRQPRCPASRHVKARMSGVTPLRVLGFDSRFLIRGYGIVQT
ncbi:hypothetical protein TRIUR3_30625 [Triticum urartu]|uniref:Uncharacterized protein n=1 Tax=Triticum urartu TaxID=4572 RepID=M7ZXZ8_TRIUA|nr:hypothetical protein TRIUR3_30625 [Triticum urartu]